MAVVPNTNFELTTISPCNAHRVVGHNAGETIAHGLPCTIHADGLIYRAYGTDAFMGMSMTDVVAGEPLTLMHGVVFRMDHGLATMTPVYLPGAAGNLNTTANGSIVGYADSDNRLRVVSV